MNPTGIRSQLVRPLTWAGFALVVFAGCKPGASALKYGTEPVARGTLAQYVTASGTLNAVVSVTVGSQVSGKIAAIYVDFKLIPPFMRRHCARPAANWPAPRPMSL